MFRQLFLLSAVALLLFPGSVLADGKGQADLDQAVEKQLLLSEGGTAADLEMVIRLCESALEKGLDDSSSALAKQILGSVAYQRAELITGEIFDPRTRSRRWPLLRQRAMDYLEKAVKASPNFGDAQLMIARLQSLPEGDPKRAMEAANGAVEAFKDSDPSKLADSLILRSNMHEDKEKAMADLEAATKTDPNNELAWRAQAAMFLGQGDLEKAISSFRAILERDPKNLIVRLAMAETLADTQKYDESLAEIDAVLKEQPDSSPAHTLKGRVLAAEEKYPESERALTKAISLDARNLPAMLLRAEVRLVQDKLLESREDAERVLSIQPNLILGIMLRSRISAMEKKYAAAIEDMDLLLENDPTNLDYKMQLALYHSLDERPRKAAKLLTEVLEVEGDNWRALRSRGDAYLSVGDHAKAIADYRKAMELEPEESGILNNLAWVLSTSPDDEVRNGEEAVKYATKACELTEYKAAHILSTLASSYAENGDFENAKKWSAKAVELSKVDDENHEQLKAELESYKEGKPWRERQETKEKEDPKKRNLLET